MDKNDSKNIEDLIAEFVNLNPAADETKRFYKNKLTSDFFLVRHDGVTLSASQMAIPEDPTFDLIFFKLDSIQKIVISPDTNLAFISYNTISKFKKKGAWGETLTFNMHSGYVVKEDNNWKMGWLQTTQKVLKN